MTHIRVTYLQTPTLHNLFCNRFCRPGRNKCRSHPGTGCTLRTSGRLRATPGRERLSVCTGHGSDFHILHTSRILASLQRVSQHCKRPDWLTQPHKHSISQTTATLFLNMYFKPCERENSSVLQTGQVLVLCNRYRLIRKEETSVSKFAKKN